MPNSSNARYWFAGLIWATFLVFGFQLAGIGPLISTLANRTGVSIETIGIMFTVQSFSSLIASTIIGSIVERFNARGVILFGVSCVTIGILGIYASQSLPQLLLSGVILGFGFSFTEVSGQLLVVSVFGDKNTRALNALHFSFSLGTVIGPLLAVQHGINMLLVAVGIMLVLVPGMFFVLPKGVNVGSKEKQVGQASLYRSTVLWIFALMILLYVGLEIGVGSWTTEYLADTSPMTRDEAGLVTSAYWFMFMISRLIVTALGHRLTFERQLFYGTVLSLIGAIGYALSSGNQTTAIISTLIIGFSYGPIYPATFAIVTRSFKGAAGKAAGVIGAAGSIGAMTIVPLQGILLKQTGGGTMVLYILVLAAAMLTCFLLATRGAANSVSPAAMPTET